MTSDDTLLQSFVAPEVDGAQQGSLGLSADSPGLGFQRGTSLAGSRSWLLSGSSTEAPIWPPPVA